MSALLLQLAMYAAIGGIGGFFAGLLGIGGGAIIGPLLIIVYTDFLAFSPQVSTHIAVATASAVIVLTAPVSAYAHKRHGNVDWRLARWLSIGAVAGAAAGAYGALQIPALLLRVMLSVFLMTIVVSLFLPANRRGKQTAPTGEPRLSRKELLPVATVIGALSAMLGIGGGAMLVPYLHYRGLVIRRAIGTSACIGFPLALSAAAGYSLIGQAADNLPPASLGYVYLPALFGVALFSMLAASAGAYFTNILPVAVLRKIFAVLMALLALRLLFSV